MKTITKALFFSAAAMLAGMSGATLAGDTAVVAVRDVQPEYPENALRRDASGHVVVRFDVDSDGKAHNIEIVESQPERTFDAAVLTAVRRSTFDVVSGSAMTDVERTYRFGYQESENAVTANRFFTAF